MFCSGFLLMKTFGFRLKFFDRNFLMLFHWFVAKRSSFETFKNGGISTEHLIEYQATELFCKSLYVCVLTLLHLTCSEIFQLSH